MSILQAQRQVQTPKQLLVAGQHTAVFFQELCRAANLEGQVQVWDVGAPAALTEFLRFFKGLRGFRESVTSVGIVCEAGAQPPEAVFAESCRSLEKAGLIPPSSLGGSGSGTPKIALFILPDGAHPGTLESLCLAALQADPKCSLQLECAKGYMDYQRGAGIAVSDETKAKLWACLAGRGQFEPNISQAARAGFWDWSNPALAPAMAFVKAL